MLPLSFVRGRGGMLYGFMLMEKLSSEAYPEHTFILSLLHTYSLRTNPYIVFLFGSLFLSCQVSHHNIVTTSAGSAVTGNYRNLFLEAGYSAVTIAEKLNITFNKLFYGDADNEKVYYTTTGNSNGPLAYIYDVNNKDVRSEGMSYGMMIAVQMNKKQEFDAIWNWSKSYMYNSKPAHPASGFFAWSVNVHGEINDDMPAPDGEEYYVTALYFAAARWGNGKGIYNYKVQADQLLNNMLHRGLITGNSKRGLTTAANLFDTTVKMVRFSANTAFANHTDPSYHLPAFYEVWARAGPQKDSMFWEQTAQTSRDYFEKAAHPATALTPDYGNFDGTPWVAPWRTESGDFRFDAWRTVMNWSMDWAWWAKDKRARYRSNKLLKFFESEGINTYGNQYSLDGKKLEEGQAIGLIAMNATAALSSANGGEKKFLAALWNTPVPRGRYRYYDGMLYMLALLNCSGEYKVYISGSL